MKKRRQPNLRYAVWALVLVTSMGTTCKTQPPQAEPNPNTLIQKNILTEMKKVADWQMQNFQYLTEGNLHDYGIDAWTNATLFVGMSEWATLTSDPSGQSWLMDKGQKSGWNIPSNFTKYPKYGIFHADELCIGQFYLCMYDRYGDEQMLLSTRERIRDIMSASRDTSMQSSNKQSWTWCDALFMAPAVYAHTWKITGDTSCLRFMDQEFKRTYTYLYDKTNKLFFRDSSYFSKTEANGEKVFWGRGNGWVAAGLVRILRLLPADSDYAPFYRALFREFVPRLAELQSGTGFWHASLLDPDSYPAPESSATALITYAMAYGINQGLLDRDTYAPRVEKAWQALSTAINGEGKLGWVQPIGADPKKVSADMTATYGIGAYLLAGSEIYRMYSRK